MKTGLIEGANGTKRWYLNGLLHREDGPAVEHADGHKWWYSNGCYLTPATEVTTISSKAEGKPSPGDLVKLVNDLRLITIVAGDDDQGYHLALLK